jgi:N-ethylmaleimide reductase
MSETLFTAFHAGAIALKNRVVMAPLTRNRARVEDDAPSDLHVEYYTQRATAGLIITEATQISPEGKGYWGTPGIHSDAQVAGWKKVTESVHAAGGKIVLQLWHVGRISHTSLQPDGQAPVAPSAVAAESQTFDGKGFVPTSVPRALRLDEMPRLLADYRHAAENAKSAGFDGVEVHAANGYLLDQFLRDTSNHRTDTYGGSIPNRARLLGEVLKAVVQVWGADRVGIRLSPFSTANAVGLDSETMALFGHVVDVLNAHALAYVHLVEGETGGTRDLPDGMDLDALRIRLKAPYMANNGYDRALAIKTVADGRADMIAFGKLFISNPDLVARLEADTEMNPLDAATMYGGGKEGYTDYPTLAKSKAA